jgi:hypothetical protein
MFSHPKTLQEGFCDFKATPVPVMQPISQLAIIKTNPRQRRGFVPPVPTVVENTVTSGSCLSIWGPVHVACAFQLFSLSYWPKYTMSSLMVAFPRSLAIIPVGSVGSCCASPAKRHLAHPQVSKSAYHDAQCFRRYARFDAEEA